MRGRGTRTFGLDPTVGIGGGWKKSDRMKEEESWEVSKPCHMRSTSDESG